MSWSTRVLLPAPGEPGTPTMVALPVCGNSSFSNGSASGRRFSIAEAARATARRSPDRIFCAQGAITLAFQELVGDSHLLDLAGSFPDWGARPVRARHLPRVIHS